MSVITSQLEVVGKREKKKVEALIDTGAEGNYINDRLFLEFWDLGITNLGETFVSLPGVHGEDKKDVLFFREIRVPNMTLSYSSLTGFIVISDIDYDAIIGIEVMERVGAIIDTGQHVIDW
jgi:predicted aspartyl protease